MTLEGFDEDNPYGLFTESYLLSLLESIDSVERFGQIHYSNFGIGVLGYAMAQSQNTTFEQLFKTYIHEKLLLKSTFLTVGEGVLTDLAIPHKDSLVMPLIQLEELRPAGGIKTTLPDLMKFLNYHIEKPEELKQTVNIVLENQLEEKNLEIGLGWGIYQIDNETVYFHNGGTYGSSSIVIIVPSKNAAVAILANNALEGDLTNYALTLINALMN